MNYQSANEAKATFDEVYHAATPHAYYGEMDRHGYAIGEEAKPFFLAAIDHLRETNPDGLHPRFLDLGCSYGVGAALVKHDLRYRELSAFFAREAPRDFTACTDLAGDWFAARSRLRDVTCVGLDASSAALRFAEAAGLLCGGIAKNFEADEKPDTAERAMLRDCNLLFSTGAIGYVGEKTLGVILEQLGRSYPENAAPLIVVTILRVFNPRPISNCFESFRFRFEKVPGVCLRQRRFTDATEQRETLTLLRGRGVDTAARESEGLLYADLYVGARGSDFEPFFEKIKNVSTND